MNFISFTDGAKPQTGSPIRAKLEMPGGARRQALEYAEGTFVALERRE
jgi:hypothetical protein